MGKRGFEVVEAYRDKDIHLPRRATEDAAGYDIEAAETVVLPSFWKTAVHYANGEGDGDEEDLKPVLVPTGLKAYMAEDEYLQITCRSSNPYQRFLVLPNGVGIIDADYYNNENNEGHIYVQLLNYGLHDVTIHKGERIAQGIFLNYLKADDEARPTAKRQGGFGSSGIN